MADHMDREPREMLTSLEPGEEYDVTHWTKGGMHVAESFGFKIDIQSVLCADMLQEPAFFWVLSIC